VKALLAFVVPSLGAIVLLSAGYSRSGFFLRITLGIGFMLGANAVRGFVEGFVENGTAGWPILYTPVVLAFMVILVMLRLGQAPWKSGLLGLLCPNGIRK
jgi:hypothetical protein